MTNKSVNQKKPQSNVAEEVMNNLTKGEESKKDKLLSLIPEGHSPKVYVDLVKTQVLGVTKEGVDRPDEDLMFFLYTAKRTGLDPLVNQVYAVYRWDNRLGREKMTIQTGIDGMRLVAQRSGEYAGQDDAKYLPEDESTQYPVKASVTVYKMLNGQRVPFTATARWSEYVQVGKDGRPSNLWAKMPYLMLAKCAEALALRKAFPNELSGIYSDVEMHQATNILGDLPTPEKFTKEEAPKVDFGAPEDTRPEMKREPKLPEAKKPDDGAAEVTQQSKPEPNKTEVKEIEPNLGAMRKHLQENGNN